jgi:hypothetical protein
VHESAIPNAGGGNGGLLNHITKLRCRTKYRYYHTWFDPHEMKFRAFELGQ